MIKLFVTKALQLKAKVAGANLAPIGRWLPATALLVIAGCSWFDEEPTPPAPSQQTAATPAPGEGEAMAGEEGEVPDINVTSPLGTALYTERQQPPPTPRSSGSIFNLS